MKPSLDPMTLLREFHDKKDQFQWSTGNPPTRFIIHYSKWMDLIEPHAQYMTRCDPPEDGKTRYEGMEVIRTHDSPGLLEFLP